MSNFITLNSENLMEEHLCCAISDKKHQDGVLNKKNWISTQIPIGHTFTKLDAKGKVFIEYTDLEKAWVSIEGSNYYYIHCLWVSGSFKKKGYGTNLIESTIKKAKENNKNGICIISSKKKKPFLSDYKFLNKFNFEVVDQIDDYLLMALSFKGDTPKFSQSAKSNTIFDEKGVRIYYSPQCPYSINCINQVKSFCQANDINLKLIKVNSLDQAKKLPSVFNNWATFVDGKFVSIHLLNETYLKKLLKIN